MSGSGRSSKVFIGLTGIALAGLMVMLAFSLRGFDLRAWFLVAFALVLLSVSAYTLSVGLRRAPTPIDPFLMRFTAVLLGTAPFLLIGVPTLCGCGGDKASYAAAKSDLRNLQSVQEIYYGDGNYVYAGDVATLQLSESEGVHVAVTGHGVDGYGATATHDLLPDVTCAVYVGDAYRVDPATEPSVVTCN